MNKVTINFSCRKCGRIVPISVYQSDLDAYQNGDVLIQDAFPYLTDGEREMFLTGICDECFEKMFEYEDEEDYDEEDELPSEELFEDDSRNAGKEKKFNNSKMSATSLEDEISEEVYELDVESKAYSY